LACAPFSSPEGQAYFKAMTCAANNAFANRQVIAHNIRRAFVEVFGKTEGELGLQTVYDVAHNIAKIERYDIEGREQEVVVHRKGATRALGPQARDLPMKYKDIGQPVLVGGSMQTGSYLLVGTDRPTETFGSTLHGSGRTMSRMQAKKMVRGDQLRRDRKQGYWCERRHEGWRKKELCEKIDDVIDAVDSIGSIRKEPSSADREY
jgi:tRNA-splicing ligase RtcB